MSSIVLRKYTIGQKSIKTIIHPVCGCRGYMAVLSQKHMTPNKRTVPLVSQDQRRQSSYYTFPAFTGTQYLLENLHDYSMMPWWGTIITSTLILRVGIACFLTVKQERTMAKMESLNPTMQEMIQILSQGIYVQGQQEGKDKEEIKKEIEKAQKKYMKENYKNNGVSRWKLFIYPWVQIPVWVSLSFALRNLCGFLPKDANSEVMYPAAPGIDTEGALWFSDLTLADPYMIIPLLILCSNLLNIELNTMVKNNPSKLGKLLKGVGRGASVFLCVIATKAPAAMSLYWAASSVSRMLEHIILKLPKVRRTFKIIKTPSEHERPLLNYFQITKDRFKKNKNFNRIQSFFK